MEMSIDKSLVNLKTLQADYQQFHDDVWQDPESYGIMAESLQEAIEIMKKYQKIEQILKDIPYGGDATVRRIQEVIEDGND